MVFNTSTLVVNNFQPIVNSPPFHLPSKVFSSFMALHFSQPTSFFFPPQYNLTCGPMKFAKFPNPLPNLSRKPPKSQNSISQVFLQTPNPSLGLLNILQFAHLVLSIKQYLSQKSRLNYTQYNLFQTPTGQVYTLSLYLIIEQLLNVIGPLQPTL